MFCTRFTLLMLISSSFVSAVSNETIEYIDTCLNHDGTLNVENVIKQWEKQKIGTRIPLTPVVRDKLIELAGKKTKKIGKQQDKPKNKQKKGKRNAKKKKRRKQHRNQEDTNSTKSYFHDQQITTWFRDVFEQCKQYCIQNNKEVSTVIISGIHKPVFVYHHSKRKLFHTEETLKDAIQLIKNKQKVKCFICSREKPFLEDINKIFEKTLSDGQGDLFFEYPAPPLIKEIAPLAAQLLESLLEESKKQAKNLLVKQVQALTSDTQEKLFFYNEEKQKLYYTLEGLNKVVDMRQGNASLIFTPL